MTINKFENLNLKECKNTALRETKNCVFYFDDELIWRSSDIESAFQIGIKGINQRDDGTFWCNLPYYNLFGHYSTDKDKFRIDSNLARKILSKLKEGDHISKVADIASVTEIQYMSGEEKRKKTNRSDVENFVISIEKPNIYRDIENENKKTFDFVEVIVNISVYHPNKIKFAREHKKEIAQMALNKIENDRKFQKYGVPISILTLKNAMLSKNNFIRYLFEVKTA